MTAPSIEQAYEIGTTETPPVEAERLAFEAWMRGRQWSQIATWDGQNYEAGPTDSASRNGNALATRWMWRAWRDRAALAKSKPASEGEAA